MLVLTGAGSSLCVTNPPGSKLKVKTAPSWEDLWDAVEGTVGRGTFASILEKLPNGADIKNIEKLLTQCKLYVELHGNADENGAMFATFITKAEIAILDRVNFVDGDSDLAAHELLLLKVARRGVRKPRTKLFTANYDLCFEYAAQRRRFVVVDGFSHASPQIYDCSHFQQDIVRREGSKEAPDYLEGVFHLYKLHGSLDWRKLSTDIIRSRSDDGAPVLIYPRDSKYQEAFEPPYFDMMAAFQAALREPDTTLLVSGFGFNDSHISRPIIAALEGNMTFRLVVCDPMLLDNTSVQGDPVTLKSGTDKLKNDTHRQLMRLAQTGDQRLALLHGRFEDLAHALPDLVAQTERERHAERIRALRELDAPAKGAVNS